MEREYNLNTPKLDGKQRLINAARVLFAQGGFDDVSVAEILAMSKLKAPSLYHHYNDKEGLYTAWALTTLKELGNNIKELESPSPEQLAQTILSGATMDLLQMQRDLRSIKQSNNITQIRDSIEANLVTPISSALKNYGIAESDLSERTNFFIHSVMYAHPAYAIGRRNTEMDSSLVPWIIQNTLGTTSNR